MHSLTEEVDADILDQSAQATVSQLQQYEPRIAENPQLKDVLYTQTRNLMDRYLLMSQFTEMACPDSAEYSAEDSQKEAFEKVRTNNCYLIDEINTDLQKFGFTPERTTSILKELIIKSRNKFERYSRKNLPTNIIPKNWAEIIEKTQNNDLPKQAFRIDPIDVAIPDTDISPKDAYGLMLSTTAART